MSARGHGSVGALRSWFEANPGEQLTYDDLVVKFAFGSRKSAKQAVCVLKTEGLLRTDVFVYADPERPRAAEPKP